MKTLKDLKGNVFKVLEDQMSLAEFEKELYRSEELLNLISKDVVLEAYSLNYRRPDAKHLLKKTVFIYFDEDEFLLWKVKSNLSDLIVSKCNRDRILYDFYCLAHDGYTFLQSIGYYRYWIEEIEDSGCSLEDALLELKRESEVLLQEIQKQELDNPGFKLSDYRSSNELAYQPLVITKEWWDFWR